MLGNILVIDDDPGVLESLELLLRGESKKVEALSDPNQLPNQLESFSFDAVLLDMNFVTGRNTGNEGLFWLKEILSKDPDLSVILITAYGDIELVVKAMKLGAVDFIQKPWRGEKLISTLKTACQLTASKRKVKTLENQQEVLREDFVRQFPDIVGESPSIKQVHATIKKVARTDTSVLVLGENGTGKELIAWEIHRQSKRKDQMFVTVDLGALSASLFESELFGHKKGAFTDARTDRAGRFEVSNEGTIFLDEIGNLPLHLQSKLLSVIQNREVIPLGSNQAIPIDVRIISATNQDLRKLVNEGLFREDLYYRINTVQITSPPLRERGPDIGLLANHFLSGFARKYSRPGLKFNKAAYEKLYRHIWPGNIRELQHVVENAVIMCENEIIKPEGITLTTSASREESGLNLEAVEKRIIEQALSRYKGNYSDIANELGISRTTLYHKIKKYDL